MKPLTLDDARIPDKIRDAFRAAEAMGHRISMFEATTGRRNHPTIVIEAWVSWASEAAAALREAGAHDAAMDSCVAMLDEREQFVAWQSPLVAVDPRLFSLVRNADVTGVSGTGRIADGVVWADGVCTIRWRTQTRSTCVYDSIADVIAIHGHGGATAVVFSDGGAP